MLARRGRATLAAASSVGADGTTGAGRTAAAAAPIDDVLAGGATGAVGCARRRAAPRPAAPEARRLPRASVVKALGRASPATAVGATAATDIGRRRRRAPAPSRGWRCRRREADRAATAQPVRRRRSTRVEESRLSPSARWTTVAVHARRSSSATARCVHRRRPRRAPSPGHGFTMEPWRASSSRVTRGSSGPSSWSSSSGSSRARRRVTLVDCKTSKATSSTGASTAEWVCSAGVASTGPVSLAGPPSDALVRAARRVHSAPPTCATRSPRAPSRRSTSSSTRSGSQPGHAGARRRLRPRPPRPRARRRGIEVVGVDIAPAFVDLAGAAAPARRHVRARRRPPPRVRRRVRRRHLAVPGRLRAGARRRRTTTAPCSRAWPGRVRPGGRLALSAFSAYFAVRFLEEGDDLRRRHRGQPRADRRCANEAGEASLRPVDVVLHAAGAAPAGAAVGPRASSTSGR